MRSTNSEYGLPYLATCHVTSMKSVKFSGESQSKKAHAPLTAKWKYFHGFLTFTDGEYTCEMQVMHLGKQHISNTLNSASFCQRHTQPFCQSRFKLKLNNRLLYLTIFFLKPFI